MNNHLAMLSTMLLPNFYDCGECGDLLLHCGEAWPYPCRYDERQVVKFKKVRAIISNIEMHRKYTTSKTNVINAYNYLIQAQSKDNKQAVLFHQILVANEYAPLLLNERHLQNYIGQNENQNVVSQNKAGFQTYFDGNLIQIGIRRGVRILTEIKRLEFNDMLGLLNALNLDYALAVKQIISNNRYKQREGLNHCCKFYQNFMLKEGNSETTVPFMEVQPHKVHYYDIYYGSVFPKPSQKTSKSELSTPKNQNSSAKKLKLKSGVSIPTTISQNPLVNEQTSFKRYLLFLSILFSADEPNQVIQYLKNSLLESKFEQQFKLRIDKLAKQPKESSLSCLAQLFLKCLSKPEEYNIHIFQKECQLLKDKYLKLKDKTNTYLIAQKDTKDLFREDRQKVSKSMITPPSSKHSQLCSKDQIVSSRHKRTNRRLRYSKSEIKLDKSVGKNSFSQGRKLKKATLKMFKDSKIEPSNPLSTLIEQTTKANKNQKMNNESCFGFARNSFNFIKISSNCQNWLNYSSMKEQQVNAKLRSFKKGSYLATINVSPQTSIPRQDVVHEVQEEKQQGNWQIIDRFSRSKAILFKKQQETKVNKMERQSKQQTQDQFTMTDSKEEANQMGSNKSGLDNKNIINTLNIKLFRQQQRKDSQIITEPPKQKIPESPKIKKNSALAATKQLNQVKQKPEVRKQSRQPEKSARVQEQRLQTPITTPKANELSKSKLSPNNSAHKISQMIKKSTFQSIQNSFTDEIQQIAFKSKQKGCLQDKNYSQKSKESTKLLEDLGPLKNNLKPTQQKSSEVRALQRNRVARPSQPKQSGKLGVVLQQAQKVFYKKHFQSILAFFKLNLSKINSTPHISNLVYLINILYYKDMIETLKSQSNTKYQQLAELIAKKQTKIPEQRKNSYLLFRVDLDQMYEWSKKVVELQNMINKGASIEKIQQQLQLGDQISAFLQLTHQACLLIDQILAQTYNYMQTNKAMLLSKDLFAILLQLCYSVTITRIICQQRLKYYTMVEGNSLQGVFNVFTFQFNQNENQYLAEYQKKLAERDITFFNVIEEFTSLKVWVQGFA